MKRTISNKILYTVLALILIVMSVTGAGCSSSRDEEGTVTTECSESEVKITSTEKAMTVTTGGSSQGASAPDVSHSTSESVRPTKPEVNVEIPPAAITVEPASPRSSSDTIGFSTGGAKDVGNFRENIENGYLPLPTDITYEGLFYDYYFDTGEDEPCEKLFCPSYSFAVTRDPFSSETEYYLSVGLNSGMKESDFERKDLNLVVVLDISGSMKSPFDSYYYDRYGTGHAVEDVDFRDEKIDIATESITALIDHLTEDDLFGLVVFNKDARTVRQLEPVDYSETRKLKSQILNLEAYGSTHLSAGMELATEMFDELEGVSQEKYENRIIFLTDAMPNTGDTSSSGLLEMARDNADNHIHTTFIGIGVDFNTELVQSIMDMPGANYYSVHSSRQFEERMDDEFEYMVTPLIFDLKLRMQADGWKIEKVFGSPEADEATGNLMTVNTLFPSSKSGGETRGGLILLKLKEYGEGGDIRLTTTYEDRNGNRDGSTAIFRINGEGPEYFDNTGIRKGVLLTRYANLMKSWLTDERIHAGKSYSWEPSIDEDTGIVIPKDNNQWERQSMQLDVSRAYRKLFEYFYRYFEDEMYELHDWELEQELDVLDMIIDS
ncbi:MAG: VWA domain-containing protein [Dehalococcoidales bacterium]|nr:VWA domain-containing protein [Dehalococcoidales bacterium]